MSRKNVSVTAPFLLLVAWLNYIDAQGIVPQALLACALHELGHYAAIRLLGGDVKYIRLTVAGAEMGLGRSLSYARELLAAAAGPAVNLLLSAALCRVPRGAVFAGVNLALAAFNLLPLGRLDGGRILSCALSMTAGPEAARVTMCCLDRLLFGVLLGLGCFLTWQGGSPTLLITALWLSALCARQEKAKKRACHSRVKQVE